VIRTRAAALRPPAFASGSRELFQSFFIGGFECATHRRQDGRRLDLIAATHHDVKAAADYRRLAEHGIRTVRDGRAGTSLKAPLANTTGPAFYRCSGLRERRARR
jgi:hypothetical protein